MANDISTRHIFGPSKRAMGPFQGGKAWNLMEQFKQRPQYDPITQPDGLINLSGALNGLMGDWMDRHVRDNIQDLRIEKLLSYGAISGSSELLSAMACFFNRFFKPAFAVREEHILATNGVTALIDLIAWGLCDPGDGILYPTPTFYMLEFDLAARTGVVNVPVSCTGIEDPFGPPGTDGLIAAFEAAADAFESRNGTKCRVLFICNPANPLGRCYSKDTLAAMAQFCRRRNMHLVADEIYALSGFNGDDGGAPHESFSSVLTIPDYGSSSDLSNVHCLYGLSKDFNLGGLRMGFIVTKNLLLRNALNRVTWFTWIANFSDAFVTKFVRNLGAVEDYLILYRERLQKAYTQTTAALVRNRIPFQGANAGLFVFVNLHRWIGYFTGPDRVSGLGAVLADEQEQLSREVQLCEWLVDRGVFLNPGEFAGSDVPGHFRLVFTEHPDAVALAIDRVRGALDELENRRSSCILNTNTMQPGGISLATSSPARTGQDGELAQKGVRI